MKSNTLEVIRDIVLSTDPSTENVPVGVSISVGGSYILKYSLSDNFKFFDDLDSITKYLERNYPNV